MNKLEASDFYNDEVFDKAFYTRVSVAEQKWVSGSEWYYFVRIFGKRIPGGWGLIGYRDSIVYGNSFKTLNSFNSENNYREVQNNLFLVTVAVKCMNCMKLISGYATDARVREGERSGVEGPTRHRLRHLQKRQYGQRRLRRVQEINSRMFLPTCTFIG